MDDPRPGPRAELSDRAASVAAMLVERRQTVAVAESSAGGLISAALLGVPGASAFYIGGTVTYSLASAQALLPRGFDAFGELRSSTRPFAECLGYSIARTLGADWGLSETGVAGPGPNAHGDPPGSSWVSVVGPNGLGASELVLTGSDLRRANMVAFAAGALALLQLRLVSLRPA